MSERKRILLVDHACHAQTHSFDFPAALLRSAAEVGAFHYEE